MTTASIDADGYTLRVSADDMLDDGDQFSVSWTVEDADGNSVEATWTFTADVSVTARLASPAFGESLLTGVPFVPVELPDAVAPNLTIASVSSVSEDATLTLTARVSGGTYDGALVVCVVGW